MKAYKQFRQLALALALMAISASSHAYLVPAGTVDGSGSGLGNVNTVLTLGAKGTGDATGSVLWNGSADVTTGDAQAINNTYSFGGLGLGLASELVFIFNAGEPNNAGSKSIKLDALDLTIYSAAGAALFTVGLENGLVFAETETGAGNSGFAFILDAGSAAAAQAFVQASNRLGLAATISSAEGGLETFFVSIVDDEGPGTGIPEPGSLALLGLGVAGLALARRKGTRRN